MEELRGEPREASAARVRVLELGFGARVWSLELDFL
jgi:hypothetical protein